MLDWCYICLDLETENPVLGAKKATFLGFGLIGLIGLRCFGVPPYREKTEKCPGPIGPLGTKGEKTDLARSKRAKVGWENRQMGDRDKAGTPRSRVF